MKLSGVQLPDTLNYVGVFLTLECNLSCSYCMNDPQQAGQREILFPIEAKSLRKSLTPANGRRH